MTKPGAISTGRWALLALLAATTLAAIPASSAYLAAGSGGFSFWWVYFSHMAPYYYLWALVSPLIYRISVNWLNPQQGWLRTFTGHAAVFLVLSFTLGSIVHYDNWRHWLLGGNAPGYHAMSAFSYLLILLGVYHYRLENRVRVQQEIISDQRRQALTLEASLASAEVEALRGQMNPHFLFNALNCIGALIEMRENDRAYDALEDLGALLRTSLEQRNRSLVPLSDELDFAQRYIAMERVRFGDRLGFDAQADSVAKTWPVPPFVLQPLIENAIKHVVAPSRGPVQIDVTATCSGNVLRLTVLNSHADVSFAASSGTGVGLANLRQRLELVYGDAANLRFNQDEASTRVELRIPEHPGSESVIRKPEPDTDKKLEAQSGLTVQHGAS